MQTIITNLDQHGRMLIPAKVREQFKILAGDKVVLEINNGELKIKSIDSNLDEIHRIFMKNNVHQGSITDDFIKSKREDFRLEEAKNKK